MRDGKANRGVQVHPCAPPRCLREPLSIGGRILSQKFGLGTVIGVARGGDGRICVVCNFRAAYGEAGKFTSKWRTWLVPAEEGVAVEVKEETDVEAR